MNSRVSAPMDWHIVTPEFPPCLGGVADYSYSMAREMTRQGANVHVWYPDATGKPPVRDNDSLHLHPLTKGYTLSGLRELDRELQDAGGRRCLFVQWVPHGFGMKSMNLPFCLWLWRRAQLGDEVHLMVHEPFLMFGEGSWKQDAAAAVHRVMMAIALRSSSHVWCAIPAWEERVKPWLLGRNVTLAWLPVPSTISVSSAPAAALPGIFSAARPMVAHFGTYGKQIVSILESSLPILLRSTNANFLFLGRDSDLWVHKWLERFPEGAGRIFGMGAQEAAPLSQAMKACDVFLQPFADGVSSRRSSVMVALAHGKPVITTAGAPTEDVWRSSRGVYLCPDAEPPTLCEALVKLLDDRNSREELAVRGKSLYAEFFQVERIVRNLLNAPRRSVKGASK